MRLHRDGVGAVWIVDDYERRVPLEELSPDDRVDLLDDLVHAAKGEEAAAINNAGEEAQLAYLLADPRSGDERQQPVSTREWWASISQPCPVPEGARVRLLAMRNDPDPVPVGAQGIVVGGNGGQLWVRWDSGRTVGLIIGVDRYEVLPSETPSEDDP